MNLQLSVKKQGLEFVAGIEAEGAYQASADTPLQAMRKWIHYVGSGVVKYRNQEITLEQLALAVGLSEAEVLEMAKIETLVPEPLQVRPVNYWAEDGN